MLRTLLWKEWRQLRHVRLSLALISLLAMPAASWLVAHDKSQTFWEVFADVGPLVLAVCIWPIAGLLVAVAVMTVDRSTGTEGFLRQRPVPFRTVLLARTLAGVGTTATVALVGALGFLSMAPFTGFALGSWDDQVLDVVGYGILATIGALLAGAVGGTLYASFGHAVLLGPLIVAVAVFVGEILRLGHPFASWGEGILGSAGRLATLVLVGGCALAPWVAFVPGEPEGRGREKRLLFLSLASVTVAAAVFLVASHLAVKRGSIEEVFEEGIRGAHVTVDDSQAKALWLFTGPASAASVWKVDIDSGLRRHFFPPPVQLLTTSPQGTEVVLGSRAGPLGSVSEPRLLLLDARDARLEREIPLGSLPTDAAWLDAGFWILEGSPPELPAVDRLDLQTGRREVVARSRRGQIIYDQGLVERRGQLLVLTHDGSGGYGRYALHRLEPDRGEGLSLPLIEEQGYVGAAEKRLSARGRYWIIQPDALEDPSRRVVRDLRTGEEHLMGTVPPEWRPRARVSPLAVWLPDGRLFWPEKRAGEIVLFVASPGTRPVELARLTGEGVSLDAEPRGERVLARVADEDGRWSLHLLVDPEEGSSRKIDGPGVAFWLGPDLLGWVGWRGEARGLALGDPDQPKDLRWVFGR